MQIGCCWLDSHRQELINQSSSRVLKLSNDEFHILTLLVSHQNKVVSKQLLLNILTLHADAELELSDAIDRIRQFLGVEYEGLLETVEDQGYLLHRHLGRGKHTLAGSPFKAMSILVYSFLTGIIFLMMFWIYSALDRPYHFDRFIVEKMQVNHGHKVEFLFYPVDNQQKKQMQPQVDFFVNQLRQCHSIPWDNISLSVSYDSELTNILMVKNDAIGKPEFSNIKLYQKAVNLDFVDLAWMEKVGICG